MPALLVMAGYGLSRAAAWLARQRARPSFAANPMRNAFEAMSSTMLPAV